MKSIFVVSWPLNQRTVVVCCIWSKLLVNVECLKNTLKSRGCIQSHRSLIRKWISHQNNWTLAVEKRKKKAKKVSYIQAFIKWLKVNVVLFVNRRCSSWIGRKVQLMMNVCFVNLTCHYCSDLLGVLTWYFCVAGEVFCGCQCFTKELQLYLLCLHFARCICNCHFYHWKHWSVLSPVCFPSQSLRVVVLSSLIVRISLVVSCLQSSWLWWSHDLPLLVPPAA